MCALFYSSVFVFISSVEYANSVFENYTTIFSQILLMYLFGISFWKFIVRFAGD